MAACKLKKFQLYIIKVERDKSMVLRTRYIQMTCISCIVTVVNGGTFYKMCLFIMQKNKNV